MATTLTQTQKQVYEYVRAYIAQHGFGPSLDEIGGAVGLKSKSSVNRIMNCLEERGLIRRLHGRPRAIEVLADMPPKVSIAEFTDGLCQLLESAQVSVALQIRVRKYVADFFGRK